MQRIVHLHGVDVARSASGGACMRIVLPLAQAAQVSERTSPGTRVPGLDRSLAGRKS
ncbi:hypothetical protein [Sinorhizobium sp. NFACC03]|uniref:hypothetical protein n=1 Tax=Sinorhizobium sp. NFACC03 TaxID=1566295 RepID=UPI003369D4D5